MSDPISPGPSFLQKLKDFATSPHAADFTITCSGQSFQVSRAVVRLHSGYFAKLFDSDWTSNKDSLIDLKEDDPDAIHAMVDYFGHFNYGGYTLQGLRYIPVLTGPELNPEIDVDANMLLHAKVWAIADKYDIPDLKTLACQRFEDDCYILLVVLPADRKRRRIGSRSGQRLKIQASAPSYWFTAVEYIYEHSSPTEPGLRASVVKMWSRVLPDYKVLFERKSWQRLIEKYPELGVDMVTALGKEVGAPRIVMAEEQ